MAENEHNELLAEAAKMRRIPKAPERARMVVARWVLVLAAISALVALWIVTKP
jgi:hypothetical protein